MHCRPGANPVSKDPLMNLPSCTLMVCSKCGSSIDKEPELMRWVSRDYGCGKCSPENEERSNLAASDNPPS